MTTTLSVKYIPSTTVDYFNTMLGGVEAMGCLVTVHVESFSCRVSRADKQTFENQRKDNQMRGNNSSGSTPNATYSSGTVQQRADDDFRFDNDPPCAQQLTNQFYECTPPTTPPLSYVSPQSQGTGILQSGRPCFPEYFAIPPANNMMGGPTGSGTLGDIGKSGSISYGGGGGVPNLLFLDESSGMTPANSNVALGVPSTPEEAYAFNLQIISDRLIYLVGTLNSLYGTAEYDFSVLEPHDFQLVNPIAFINEISGMLSQFPQEILSYTGHNGEAFWRAVASMVGGEAAIYDPNTNMSECDVFLFRCPQCDPTAQTKIWSSHYFIYHKKNRVMISVLAFGDGNMYRGDQLGFIGTAGGAMSGMVVGSPNAAGMPSSESSGQMGPQHHYQHQQHYNYNQNNANGEFYIDGDGNTHVIGANEYGHDDDAARRGGGSSMDAHNTSQHYQGGASGHGHYYHHSQPSRTPTDMCDSDTPHHDTSDWGGEEQMGEEYTGKNRDFYGF